MATIIKTPQTWTPNLSKLPGVILLLRFGNGAGHAAQQYPGTLKKQAEGPQYPAVSINWGSCFWVFLQWPLRAPLFWVYIRALDFWKLPPLSADSEVQIDPHN